MKNIAITAAVSLVVFLVGIGFVRPVQQVVEKVTNTQLGAVVGPDSYFPCETHNGVQTCFERQTMAKATTTICAMKSPTATSSLSLASVNFIVSTTTASRVTIAKAATAFATTTLLAAGNLGASADGAFVASTTASGGATVDGTNIFSPNTYVVVSMAGGVGTFSPVGTCNARWDVL